MKQIAYFITCLIALFVFAVLKLAENAQWRYWKKYQIRFTDGHHAMVNGRCRVK